MQTTNVTREVGRRLGKRAYEKENINKSEKNNNTNIRDLYRSVNCFRNLNLSNGPT